MIEQVLLNLVVNARDAMPDGGKLSITTKRLRVSADHVQSHPEAREGEFVRLSVTDTGMGIHPEHLRRIFEPFFTTKEAGKGTGLGLATVFDIVRQHSGWIEVSTRVAAGTTFAVYLPAICGFAETQRITTTNGSPLGEHEGFLPMENGQPSHPSSRQLVENLGYAVHEAAIR
jgi:signal transduction histidine kinase